jgi:Transglutaminase-like superfamily
MKQHVSAELDVDISAPTTLEFQIAVAPHPGADVDESLSLVLDGKPIAALEISGAHGNRIHKFDAPIGNLQVAYTATIVGQTYPAPVTEYDLSMYLRPSRYAEADKFYGFAATEFGEFADSTTLLEKVSSWVGTRLNYMPGSSDPIDGAVDTLLAGNGVDRDYAHLVVALLRAVNVPARLVRSMRRVCPRWTFTLLPRRWSTDSGGGRRDMPGAAADVGADRHGTRRRRHRLPGQPQRRDQLEQHDGHRDIRRRSPERLCRPTGLDPVVGSSIVIVAAVPSWLLTRAEAVRFLKTAERHRLYALWAGQRSP